MESGRVGMSVWSRLRGLRLFTGFRQGFTHWSEWLLYADSGAGTNWEQHCLSSWKANWKRNRTVPRKDVPVFVILLFTLSLSLPSTRIQELKDLGELSPHWDNLRREVITRYDQVIRSYQETLEELDKLTGQSAPMFKTSNGPELDPLKWNTSKLIWKRKHGMGGI